VPGDAPRPCLVHGLDRASRSKALSSQGPRAFFFSRAATRVCSPSPLRPPSAISSRRSMVQPRGNLISESAQHLFPGDVAFGCQVANRSRYTSLICTRWNCELSRERSHEIPSIRNWSAYVIQGMTMINRTVFENEPFSHCQSTTVASVRRRHANGREDLGQRTQRFHLSRIAT
jgi:hypothetical protein